MLRGYGGVGRRLADGHGVAVRDQRGVLGPSAVSGLAVPGQMVGNWRLVTFDLKIKILFIR